MGKRSVRENKNVYQLSREGRDFTREEASEALVFLSPEPAGGSKAAGPRRTRTRCWRWSARTGTRS